MPIMGHLLIKPTNEATMHAATEQVFTGELAAAVETTRFFGEINPNYTRENGPLTQTAITAAECMVSMAQGLEESDSYHGTPKQRYRHEEEGGQLSDNRDASQAACTAKLLIEKTGEHGFPNYSLSYGGRQLVAKHGTEFLDVTPEMKRPHVLYSLGKVGFTLFGMYASHRAGVDWAEDTGQGGIDTPIAYLQGLVGSMGVVTAVNIYSNRLRCLIRARGARKTYLQNVEKQ